MHCPEEYLSTLLPSDMPFERGDIVRLFSACRVQIRGSMPLRDFSSDWNRWRNSNPVQYWVRRIAACLVVGIVLKFRDISQSDISFCFLVCPWRLFQLKNVRDCTFMTSPPPPRKTPTWVTLVLSKCLLLSITISDRRVETYLSLSVPVILLPGSLRQDSAEF